MSNSDHMNPGTKRDNVLEFPYRRSSRLENDSIWRGKQVAQYAIAFDLNTRQMRDDGLSQADITKVYQVEIPTALATCGFTAHPQGSLYHTEADQDPIRALIQLKTTLSTEAPQFCKYVKRVHVFRMEDWSDVTMVVAERSDDGVVDADDEAEAAEYLS